MIYRRCDNCHQLYAGKFCIPCHKKFALDNAKKRQSEDEGRKLYGSYAWEKVRKHIRIKYMDYDIWLLGAGQVYKCKKPYIHHIIERDVAPGLVFNEDNLITVCKESHEEIHRQYLIDRPKALARIEKGITRFKEMFKDD